MLKVFAIILVLTVLVLTEVLSGNIASASTSRPNVARFFQVVATIMLLVTFGQEIIKKTESVTEVLKRIDVNSWRLVIYSTLGGALCAVVSNLGYIFELPAPVDLDKTILTPGIDSAVGTNEWWKTWWEKHPHEWTKFARLVGFGAVIGLTLNALYIGAVAVLVASQDETLVLRRLAVSGFFLTTVLVTGGYVATTSYMSEVGRFLVEQTGLPLNFGSGACANMAEYIKYWPDKCMNMANNSRCDVGATSIMEIALALVLFSSFWMIAVMKDRGDIASLKDLYRVLRKQLRIYLLISIACLVVVGVMFIIYGAGVESVVRQVFVESEFGLTVLAVLFASASAVNVRFLAELAVIKHQRIRPLQ